MTSMHCCMTCAINSMCCVHSMTASSSEQACCMQIQHSATVYAGTIHDSMCGIFRCLGLVCAVVVVSCTTSQLALQPACKNYICLSCVCIVAMQCRPWHCLQRD